jgi:hypothetical protein
MHVCILCLSQSIHHQHVSIAIATNFQGNLQEYRESKQSVETLSELLDVKWFTYAFLQTVCIPHILISYPEDCHNGD